MNPTSLYYRNNEAQVELAKEGLDRYNSKIRMADYTAKRDIVGVIQSVDELLTKTKGRRIEGLGEVREKALALKERLQRETSQAASEIAEDKGIEVIINQYNGKTEVILPIKPEDLTEKGDSLADRLYQLCEEACEDYEVGEEGLFCGYKRFSLAEGAGRQEVAKSILGKATPEFQGNPLYLRVAHNFCFKYERADDEGKEKEREAGEEEIEKRGSESAALPAPALPSGNTISREECILLFAQGLRSPEIHRRYPGTPTMTVAGYRAAWTRGCYGK